MTNDSLLTGINGLISIAEGAIEDTRKWETKSIRFQKFNLIWLVALLAYWLFLLIWGASLLSHLLMALAVAISVGTIKMQANHRRWIIARRKYWEGTKYHWEAARIEYNQQGYVNEWVWWKKDPEDA